MQQQHWAVFEAEATGGLSPKAGTWAGRFQAAASRTNQMSDGTDIGFACAPALLEPWALQ